MSPTATNGSAPFRADENEALPSFADYVAVLRRRVRLVMLCTVIGALMGGAMVATQSRSFTSTASVLASDVPGDTAPSSGRSTLNMENQIELVRSSAVVEKTAETLGLDPDVVKPAISAEVATENSNVLVISFAAPTRAEARAGATAVAEQYLILRTEIGTEALTVRLAPLRTEQATLQTELDQANTIQASSADRIEIARAQARASQLSDQIGSLRAEITREEVAVLPGQVIAGPSNPRGKGLIGRMLPLFIGALAGLFIGIFVAFVRDRLDGKLRAVDDINRLPIPQIGVVERLAAPGLASVDGETDIVREDEPLLRLGFTVAALMDHHGARTCVIVTPAGAPSRLAGVLVSSLAIAMASRSRRITVVAGDLRSNSIQSAFGLDGRPGVHDYCEHQVPYSNVCHPIRGRVGLSVLPGGTGGISPLVTLQSAEFATLMKTATQQSKYVLMDGPSVDIGADALMLAGAADLVILAVTPETDVAAVESACAQLGMLDAVVGGFVMVQRSSGQSSGRPRRSRSKASPSTGRPADPPAGPPPSALSDVSAN